MQPRRNRTRRRGLRRWSDKPGATGPLQWFETTATADTSKYVDSDAQIGSLHKMKNGWEERTVVFTAITAIAGLLPSLAGDPINLAALISDAERKREANVEEVRSLRQYTVRNKRWKSDAVMQARMITSADGTK